MNLLLRLYIRISLFLFTLLGVRKQFDKSVKNWEPRYPETGRQMLEEMAYGPGWLPGETGAENADRFARAVLAKIVLDESTVWEIMYGAKWVWMANEDWRALVKQLLEQHQWIEYVEFAPPDSYDTWTMNARIRETTRQRISKLSLDTKL